MIDQRLPDRPFTRGEAECLAALLSAAEVLHCRWKASDIMLNSPRRMYLAYARDSRVGTLRALIELAFDE